MRISAKGRYALAATVSMAAQYDAGGYITVISISEKLGISKIYLEQVFSLLKRAGVLSAVKGSQGGYQLKRPPRQITVLDVLLAVELSLFERTEETVPKSAPDIEAAMRLSVFNILEDRIKTGLKEITLYDLVNEAQKHRTDQGYMFFI